MGQDGTTTKDQIILIHGGEVFENDEEYYEYLRNYPYNPLIRKQNWREWLGLKLADSYEVMAPVMPNKYNAEYRAWKIWFEKLFPYLNNDRHVLVGYSLGTIFLAKWLSENKFPKHINQLHLVAALFDSEGLDIKTLKDFVLAPSKIANVSAQVDSIHIYHSKDDPLIPFSHAEKYHSLLPGSQLHTFTDRGHFYQPVFTELLEQISA